MQAGPEEDPNAKQDAIDPHTEVNDPTAKNEASQVLSVLKRKRSRLLLTLQEPS